MPPLIDPFPTVRKLAAEIGVTYMDIFTARVELSRLKTTYDGALLKNAGRDRLIT